MTDDREPAEGTDDEPPFGQQLYDAMRAELNAIPFGLTYDEIQKFKASDRETLARAMRSESYAFIQMIRSSSIEEIVAEARRAVERRQQAGQAAVSMLMFSSFYFS